MKITNAKWFDGPTGQVKHVIRATINEKEMWVPVDTDNTHYAEILRQVAAGELTIADAD